MEIDKPPFVFQTDSEIVKAALIQDNYLIEYNEQCPNRNTCAIYFSSNDIYFPNTEAVFRKRIVERNFYEWYNSRIEKAYKHIFIRDICKQWYLGGINTRIDTPEKLLEFLKEQTEGYSVFTLGSSAGGYAAVLYGQLLSAEVSLSFNGQFMLTDLLESSTEDKNPFVFRFRDNEETNKYYSLREFITCPDRIFYFTSNKSLWDIEQLKHLDGKSINVLSFNTSHHGIPFLKVALKKVINTPSDKLKKHTIRRNNPLLFTISFVGVTATFLFFLQIALKRMLKK